MEQLNSLKKQIDLLNNKVNKYQKRILAALDGRYTIDSIISCSEIMNTFKKTLLRFAKTDAPILINGPTGTGKELAASAIHNASARADGPFVCLNCAAIPYELFESELFGYSSGAFSGASKEGKEGQIELANHGTLFLDEVGDLPLNTQVKLLRVIEERLVRKIGDNTPKEVDFRLVTATNRDLKKMVANGTFRLDLYYRINSMVLNVPPLKDRPEDVPLLTNYFLKRFGNISCSKEVMEIFKSYTWPGNIRELKNTISYACSIVENGVIGVNDIPNSIIIESKFTNKENDRSYSLSCLKTNTEKNIIIQCLNDNNWNITKASKILGISRANMYEKMKKLNIKRSTRFV